jgi:hypothetical protein
MSRPGADLKDGRQGLQQGDAQALIPEARARQRRRHMVGVLVLAGIVAALFTSVLVVTMQTGPPATSTTGMGSAPHSVDTSAPSFAWIDYVGHLHVGDPLTGQQQVVARALGDPTVPVVALQGRLFWVDTGCTSLPVLRCPDAPESGYSTPVIKELDLQTHRVKILASGQAVFAAADGRSIYIERQRPGCLTTTGGVCDPHAEEVVRVPITPSGKTKVYFVPHGWDVNAGNGFSNPISVPGGIFVQSNLAGVSSTPLHFALWNPATDHVVPMGYDWGLIDAHTSSDGTTLLAWLPGTCELQQECGLDITNVGTGKTLSIPSPLPYGFDIGGAFSPDGAQLAVFVRTNQGDVNPAMEFGVVDTKAGKLRLIEGVQGQIGDSVGWAHWLPNGTDVLVGTFAGRNRTYNHYLVDTKSDTVKLVDFSSNPNLDVNFSSSSVIGGS